MTKDLSYSIFSLKPKDTRESKIYFQYRLKDVYDLYAYYLGMLIFLPIVDGLVFYSERTLFFFLVMIYTIVVTILRYLCYCFRHRYPGVYNAHILLFYILGQVRYATVAYYKFTQVEDSMKTEMAGVVFKTAQD